MTTRKAGDETNDTLLWLNNDFSTLSSLQHHPKGKL